MIKYFITDRAMGPQELSAAKAYEETSGEETSIVFGNCNDRALTLSVNVKEQQNTQSAMYWLPKLLKRPYKAKFTANSSACITTVLSKVLISCLTAIKIHVIRFCEKCRKGQENLFWSIENSTQVLDKPKSKGFHSSIVCLQTVFQHSIQFCPIIKSRRNLCI